MEPKSIIRSMLITVSACIAGLILLSAAHASDFAVTEISPDKGTIGTVFTISGSDFGTSRGLVFIGNSPCKTLSWGDTSIMAQVLLPMPPGEYNVVVRFPGGFYSRLILPNAFSIMPPELAPPESRPHFVSPGDVVTVDGEFFGQGYGRPRVEIENLRGERMACRVLDSTMDTIAFELPDGTPGIFGLYVSNAVGSDIQPWWGTFAEPPENPPGLLGSYTGMTTHDNASAASYFGKLYVFYSHRDADDGGRIAYRIWDGKDWSDGKYVLHRSDTSDDIQYNYSMAQVTPVVADDILYLFYTGKNGHLYYVIYNYYDNLNAEGNQKSDYTWGWATRIPDTTVQDISGRFAAVYNFNKKWFEIYWSPDSASVKMKTFSIESNTWSQTTDVILPTKSNIAPYLTAVFNQFSEEGSDFIDYVTYLSWADGSAGYLAELKDGVIIQDGEKLRYVSAPEWLPVNKQKGPSLADLTFDHLAIITNKDNEKSRYQKYDKMAHAKVGTAMTSVGFSSPQDTDWVPTGVIFSKAVADSTSPTGTRMNTDFYVFVGNNPVAQNTKWEFVHCEFLGYWTPTSALGTELDMDNDQLLGSTFEQWPLLGVVDMPPFVENGHECSEAEWESCGTEVQYITEESTETGWSFDVQVGGYYRTRAFSKIEADVHLGFAYSREKTTTYTYIQSDTLLASHEGFIMAYYLVPKSRVFELEWHDLNGLPTGFFTESVQMSGMKIRKEVFTPHDGPYMSEIPKPYLDPGVFPYHEAEDDVERLESYLIQDPYDFGFTSDFHPVYCSWYPKSPCDFSMEVSTTTTNDLGGYFRGKIAYKGEWGVAGIEGDFNFMHKSTTTNGVTTVSKFRGSKEFEGAGPWVNTFDVQGYWLKGDNSGYWVPEYRRKAGDKPWFITYRVTYYD